MKKTALKIIAIFATGIVSASIHAQNTLHEENVQHAHKEHQASSHAVQSTAANLGLSVKSSNAEIESAVRSAVKANSRAIDSIVTNAILATVPTADTPNAKEKIILILNAAISSGVYTQEEVTRILAAAGKARPELAGQLGDAFFVSAPETPSGATAGGNGGDGENSGKNTRLTPVVIQGAPVIPPVTTP